MHVCFKLVRVRLGRITLCYVLFGISRSPNPVRKELPNIFETCLCALG